MPKKAEPETNASMHVIYSGCGPIWSRGPRKGKGKQGSQKQVNIVKLTTAVGSRVLDPWCFEEPYKMHLRTVCLEAEMKKHVPLASVPLGSRVAQR